jgi:hypothetical protein
MPSAFNAATIRIGKENDIKVIELVGERSRFPPVETTANIGYSNATTIISVARKMYVGSREAHEP